MKTEKATADDLAFIIDWLKAEFDEDGKEGFWHNRNIISEALENGQLWVIREGEKAVAFQVGDYSPIITNVRKDKQRQGYGTALFEASLARAFRDNVNVLKGECYPQSSLPFWEKHGFKRYGDLSDWGKITVRLVLKREFNISSDQPQVDVAIGFYPEAASYGQNVEPIVVHRVVGARQNDGVLLLQRRVIGLADDEPKGRDLAVRIEVDGVQQCFCKAKRREAQEVGLVRDTKSNAFFIDAIQTRSTEHL